MSKHPQSILKLKRRHIIFSLVFALVACGIVYYLFYSAGPISRYLHIDLSFLILPFLSYYILRLFSRLGGFLIRSRFGPVTAHVINCIAFSLLSYLILGRATLFTRITGLSGAQGFLSNLSHVAIYSILFFVGYTVAKLAGLFKSGSRERNASPIISTVGEVLMGYCLWQSFAVFAGSWSPAGEIGLVFFSAMLAVAVSNLGAYGENAGNPLLADASHWLRASSAVKFFLGGIIAAYVIFIRPAIFSFSSYAFLIEWVILCIVAWRIFAGIKGSLQKRYSVPLTEENWKKHIQKVDNLKDEDFNKVVILQEDFVEARSRHDLLAYLKQMLVNNGLNEDEIGQTLYHIIEHNDRKVPWYAFGFWRHRILRQNRRNRRQALDNMVKNLGAIIHPAQRKI